MTEHIVFFGGCFALVLGIRGFMRKGGSTERMGAVLLFCMSWSHLHTLFDGMIPVHGVTLRIPVLTNLVLAAVVLRMFVISLAFPGHQKLGTRRILCWLILPTLVMDTALVFLPHHSRLHVPGVDAVHALGGLLLVLSSLSGLWAMFRQRVRLLRNPKSLYVTILSLSVFLLILLGLIGLALSEKTLLDIMSVGFTVLLIVQFLMTERHTELLEDYRKDVVREAYRNSSLKGCDTEQMKVSLISLMEEQHPYLEENCSLQRLADALGISGHQLSELLNRIMGVSFPRFIHGYRIRTAKELLSRDPEKTVLEIAYEVGYGNKTSFNEAFRNITKMTPRQYRKTIFESQE